MVRDYSWGCYYNRKPNYTQKLSENVQKMRDLELVASSAVSTAPRP